MKGGPHGLFRYHAGTVEQARQTRLREVINNEKVGKEVVTDASTLPRLKRFNRENVPS